jgi:hypothetical protein
MEFEYDMLTGVCGSSSNEVGPTEGPHVILGGILELFKTGFAFVCDSSAYFERCEDYKIDYEIADD